MAARGDDRALRSCLGRFATGVAVVTFATPEGPRGITVNSFTSVSVAPPLVLVAVALRASAHDRLIDRPFCVNVLAAEQEELARQFAGARAGASGGAGATGAAAVPIVWIDDEPAPRLAGVLAHLGCRPWRRHDGGDHTLFLGEVVDFAYRDGDALAFHTSRFTQIADRELGIEDLI